MSATVRSVIERGVICTLESGLSGFIPKHEITDTEHMIEPIMSKVSFRRSIALWYASMLVGGF